MADPRDILRQVVDSAVGLKPEEQQTSVPAAVQVMLNESDDRSESARNLLRTLDGVRAHLPASAESLLDLIAKTLESQISGDCKVGEGTEHTGDVRLGAAEIEKDANQSDDSEVDESELTPFTIGPFKMELSILLIIAQCLEPLDLTPAAAACKSLCIPININLQYILFLVRLLRLIVLGPELANQLNEQDSSSDSGSTPRSCVSSDAEDT
eukprot:TRINITY_DN64220_c0_g1_i1.p1 TRINITY_DN64220_c0_g1~~TRINITY_DN64220_c0_g1_i1.p1  ORF type:complete len:239 (-),score=25.65 TRINITY_DN64220_c0_g1_i1:58-690(-)